MQNYSTTKKKIRKAVRLAVTQAMIVIAINQTVFAYEEDTLEVLDREVTVRLTEVTLKQALNEIGKAANVKFVYSEEQLPMNELVTLNATGKKLRELLYELLEPRSINYSIDETHELVMLKRMKKKSSDDHSSLKEKDDTPRTETLMYSRITGSVTDGLTKQPLAGVNVIVKGTTKGTSTDADGNYVIEAEENDMLVFSFIGYVTYEMRVAGNSTINVSLEEDSKKLSEVVVNAGYWNVSDRERTGNIAKVTSETISKQPVSNPLLALQGRMAGVVITQQNGVPGSALTVQIRGRNSLRSNGDNPLYIVDGVPFTSTPLSTSSDILPNGISPLSSINPSDIESIEVLKDADATAIYGSRGANGVILITTKKGSAGKTKVDVNIYTGMGNVARYMDLLNTQQYLEMRKEAFKNDKVTPTISNAPDLMVWDTTRYTDWQKKMIGGTSKITNAQTSISGGNSNTQFVVGTGFYRESTVFPGDYADTKVSAHFNLNHTSENKRFKAQFTASFVSDNNQLLRTDLTTKALQLPPDAPAIYDENGKLNWANSTWTNPYSELLKKYEARTSNLIGNALLSYKIIEGLQVKTSLGYTSMSVKEFDTQPISSQNPTFNPKGILTQSNSSINTWIVEPQAEYNKVIGQAKLNLIAGGTFQQNVNEAQTFYGNGYTSDALLENLLAAPSVYVLSSNYTQYRYAAAFGRFNFTWGGKYIVNLTGRRDGSSRFGADKRFANFGAIGAAWIFTDENFLKNNVSFLSFGKLRWSYGVTGSDQIPDYGYLDTFAPTSYPYGGGVGLVPTKLVNPDFAWESNKKMEAAIDLGFINDRIMLSASLYRNRSSNQLVGYPLPAITGQTTIQYNLPATVQNTGLEISLQTQNIKTRSFTWTTNINFTVPKNKLVEYPNLSGSSYANTYVVGEPLSISKAYQYTGVDPQTGTYTYKDVNNDGAVTSEKDLQTIMRLGQKFYSGIQNGFRYNNWQLDFLFQFVKQEGRTYIYSPNFGVPGNRTNQPVAVMDRWQKSGDVSTTQGFTQLPSSGVFATAYTLARSGENSFGDASYIRLKNVSLSYTLPEGISQKLRLQSSRIYLQGQNLLTITNYQGMDPENQRFINLPALRVLSAGLQLTF
ncbi:MAG: SusC/RagA family TonB-linked outer membrane protein [Bacteroidota bacterium]